MRDLLASAGDGPAPTQALENDAIPAAARLRAALGTCESLLGDCSRIAADMNVSSATQMLAAATAAKLAAASAHAASAIARLADAETHQRLASTKIELSLLPSTRRPARRGGDNPEPEKSTNNRPPRIWSP